MKKFNLLNSKGISVIFLMIAMLLMVTIGYVFSYLIPSKQKSVVLSVQSTQAFFLAQSGVEFAIRWAKDNGWTSPTSLNANLNGLSRTLGPGSFSLAYNPATNTLTSSGQVPSGTTRRTITVSNFTSFLSYYAYRRTITVQPGQVAGGPHLNFPMLISITAPELRTVANGGRIASYNAATNDPQDLTFWGLDDTTCGGVGTSPCVLSHEIEHYSPTTGQLIAWVKVPSINNGTTIYMYYGNGCAASMQNPNGVWTDYRGVWHLNQDPTLPAPQMRDSTVNAYHGTAVGSFVSSDQQPAVINGGLNFDSITNDEIRISAANLGATSVTVSAWIRVKSFTETTFSASTGNLGAVVFSTRNADCDVSPTLVVSPASGGAGTHQGLVFCNDSCNVARGAKGATAIALNTWYYAVGTFRRTGTGPFAGDWNVYLNGVQNNTSTNNFNFAGTATGIFTGASWRHSNNPRWPDPGLQTSNVILDEVRVATLVRSADWILTEYRNQSAPGTFATLGPEQNN